MNTPEDYGFHKKADYGHSGFVYEKTTPDFDLNPRLTADRYGGSEEWLVKLVVPDGNGGEKEVDWRTAWSASDARGKGLDILRSYYDQ